MKKILSLFLAFALVLVSLSCKSTLTDESEANIDSQTGDSKESGNSGLGLLSLTNGLQPALPELEKPENSDYSAITHLGAELLSYAKGDNPLVSPLSAYMALSMAAQGAGGETCSQMETLLGKNHGAVSLELLKYLDNKRGKDNKLIAANSVWVSSDANVRENYLHCLVDIYSAEVYSGNLYSEETMRGINRWIDSKTEGLIPSLLSAPLNNDSALVLINTLYLRSNWADPFDPDLTEDRIFHAASGDVEAPFMRRIDDIGYLSGDGWEGAVLRYYGGAFRFAALKPTEGTARDLLKALDGKDLAAIIAGDAIYMDLRLPKLDLDVRTDITSLLPDLGIDLSVDPMNADFSGIGTGRDGNPLYIGQMLHQVRMILNEDGTEAAAATEEEVFCLGLDDDLEPIVPYLMSFDEPFVYIILENSHSTPLFMGIMDDPSI